MGKRVYAKDGTYRVVDKAANGEGSVYQRADGRWCAYVQGVSFYGRTRAEAKRKRKEALGRVEVGAPVRDSKITVAAWMKQWRGKDGNLEVSNRSESTKILYRSLSEKHIEPAPFGELGLDKLSADDIEQHLGNTLKDKKLSESTRRSVYAVLRAALTIAKRDKLIGFNPVLDVERPSVTTKDAMHLNAEQVKKLLKAAEQSRYYTLLRFIVSTGVRKGEAIATRWDDLDLEAGLYRVPGTKTEGSRRPLPLSPALLAMLEVHKAVQDGERELAANLWHESNLVFATEFGTKVDARNVLRVVKNAAKDAGLAKDVNVHTLRHSAATILADSKVSVKVISEVLGHADTEITGNTYLHGSTEAARVAMNVLSDALGL